MTYKVVIFSAGICLHITGSKNFDLVEFIATCAWYDSLDAVELLPCSSLCFLDKLLPMSLLRYFLGPKWACPTYCTHAESSYLTVKLASSDLLFSSNQFVKRILVNFRDAWFSRCINFRIYRSLAKFRRASYFTNTMVVVNRENLLRQYFRKYGISNWWLIDFVGLQFCKPNRKATKTFKNIQERADFTNFQFWHSHFPTGDKVSRVLIHLPSVIFPTHVLWLRVNSMTMIAKSNSSSVTHYWSSSSLKTLQPFGAWYRHFVEPVTNQDVKHWRRSAVPNETWEDTRDC